MCYDDCWECACCGRPGRGEPALTRPGPLGNGYCADCAPTRLALERIERRIWLVLALSVAVAIVSAWWLL